MQGTIALLLASALASLIKAAAAQGIPCESCPRFARPAWPESGFWYIPSRPGSGFALEMQGGVLAGGYFAVLEGRQTWYTLSGPLQPLESPSPFRWRLSTQLYRSSAACEGCVASPRPEIEIELEFDQRSSGRFRIGGRPWESFSPLNFGFAANADFAPQITTQIPRLEGPWVLVYRKPGQPADYSLYYSYSVEAFSDGNLLDARSSYGFSQVLSAAESILIATLDCHAEHESSAVCNFTQLFGRNGTPIRPGKTFVFPVGNLAPTRFLGEAEDGETVEGFRLNAD